MSLGTKLVGFFMIMACIVAITGTIGIWNINRVGSQVSSILKHHADQERTALLMAAAGKDAFSAVLEASLVREMPQFLMSAGAYRKNRDLFRKYSQALATGKVDGEEGDGAVSAKIATLSTSIGGNWSRFEKTADAVLAYKKDLLEKHSPVAIDARLSTLLAKDLKELAEKVRLESSYLSDHLENLTYSTTRETEEINNSVIIAFVAVILGAVVAAGVLGVIVSQKLSGTVSQLTSAVKVQAEGDLTARVAINSEDELGELADNFNQMVEKLAAMIGRIRSSADELRHIASSIQKMSSQVVGAAEVQATSVSEASTAIMSINSSLGEMREGIEQLTQAASESSSSVLEIAASVEEVAVNAETLSRSVDDVSSSIMEMAASIKQIDHNIVSLMEASTTTAFSVSQMTSSINQVQHNALETAQISDNVLLDAESGKTAVEATIAGMAEIRRSADITSRVIGSLTTKVDDIGVVLSVIDDVAEQTNLLALNASIIAAQAGEHGKGFSVVADEIRDLAERTSSSTREIADIIKGVQEETRQASVAMSHAAASIVTGGKLSQNSGEALEKILVGMRQAAFQVNEIAAATVEQAKGSELIREAMNHVATMVEEIARATREQGRGSEMIMSSVETMKSLTAQVRTSTREQSNTGTLIARSTESISGMVHTISDACREQGEGSRQIDTAVDGIQQSTAVNLDAAHVMDDAVRRLQDQIELLQKAVSGFTISRTGSDA